MDNIIRKILREYVENFSVDEAQHIFTNEHAKNRLYSRLLNGKFHLEKVVNAGDPKALNVSRPYTKMVGEYVLPEDVMDSIKNKIEELYKFDFPKDKKYLVVLKKLNINIDDPNIKWSSEEIKNETSDESLNKKIMGFYIRPITEKDDDKFHGNIICVRIDNDIIETIMWVREYQIKNKTKEEFGGFDEILTMDNDVKNINDYYTYVDDVNSQRKKEENPTPQNYRFDSDVSRQLNVARMEAKRKKEEKEKLKQEKEKFNQEKEDILKGGRFEYSLSRQSLRELKNMFKRDSIQYYDGDEFDSMDSFAFYPDEYDKLMDILSVKNLNITYVDPKGRRRTITSPRYEKYKVGLFGMGHIPGIFSEKSNFMTPYQKELTNIINDPKLKERDSKIFNYGLRSINDSKQENQYLFDFIMDNIYHPWRYNFR